MPRNRPARGTIDLNRRQSDAERTIDMILQRNDAIVLLRPFELQ